MEKRRRRGTEEEQARRELIRGFLSAANIQSIYNPRSVAMSMTGHDRTTTFSESKGISVSMQL